MNPSNSPLATARGFFRAGLPLYRLWGNAGTDAREVNAKVQPVRQCG
ncbi:MAG: hypothetical protein LBT65_04685 [Synergistaceae bacterium]|nr:hypothetical protein [Synergistaceae bacterium]